MCERDDDGNIELPDEIKPQPLGREETLRLYGQHIKLRPWEIERLVADRLQPRR